MNKRGGLLQFIIFIGLVAFLSYLFFYIPGVDISKPVLEKEEVCRVTVKNSPLQLTEGQDGIISADVYSDLAGVYNVSLIHSPVFADAEDTIFISAKNTVKFDIYFTNASISEDYLTKWYDARILISGPLECEGGFQFILNDNCLEFFNPDQTDVDNDGIGDLCDNSICNNSICEPGENRTNCCNDCGCIPGQNCTNNKCTGEPYLCSINSDCNDYTICTRDVCFHANTTYAQCGHLEITKCGEDNSDGCCPENCDANKDIDCGAVCGNGICENLYYKESYSDCKVDCPEED